MGYFQLNGIPWQVEMFTYTLEGLTLDAICAGTEYERSWGHLFNTF